MSSQLSQNNSADRMVFEATVIGVSLSGLVIIVVSDGSMILINSDDVVLRTDSNGNIIVPTMTKVEVKVVQLLCWTASRMMMMIKRPSSLLMLIWTKAINARQEDVLVVYGRA